jgi:DNA-binding SARP family transcriptional activator/TolB-like protein/Tfp pilus assembly protein PilF
MRGRMFLELNLLGGFAAHFQNSDAAPLRLNFRKGRALLAYLAMQPGYRARRGQLADLLWGDRTDAVARHNLRQCLLLLRRSFSAANTDVLNVVDTDIHMDARSVSVDVLEFQALAESKDVEGLTRAAALYRGEFLAGLVLNVEPFDEWLQGERTRLESIAVGVFERLAKLQSDSGDGSAAIAAGERLVACDPLREDWQQLLIGIYARYRSPAVALAHAKNLKTLLRRELDVAPAPETCALLEKIRNASIEALPIEEHKVPALSALDRVDAPEPGAVMATGTRPDEIAERAGNTDRPVESAITGSIVEPEKPNPIITVRRSLPVRTILAASVAVFIGIVAISKAMIIITDPPAPAQLTQILAVSRSDRDPAEASWRSPLSSSSAKIDMSAIEAKGLYAVAVMPFAIEESNGEDDRILAERIARSLVENLSRSSGLRVISWSTSRQYGGRPIDVVAIGAELGTRYIIEGSIRRQKTRLRVSVALVDARNRLQVWSDLFERDLHESSTVQEEITRGLARRLQVNVVEVGAQSGYPAGQHDPTTGELIAKGWAAFLKSASSGSAAAAKSFFERALAGDPHNVSALTGLGAYHTRAAGYQIDADRVTHLKQAKRLLTEAIEKAPSFCLPPFFLGRIHKMHGDYSGARELLAKALALNPSFAAAYAEIGQLIGLLGNLEEGMDHIRYAMRLSPRDPAMTIWQLYAGQLTLEQGKVQEAIDWLERAVAFSPKIAIYRAFLAAAYAENGNAAGAAAQVAEVRKLAPWLTAESIVRRFAGRPVGVLKTQRLISAIRMAFEAKS